MSTSTTQDPLWRFDDLVRATAAKADGEGRPDITGLSIDTRSLAKGDLFVALKDQRDGHDFVANAFAAGAAAALVRHDYARKPADGMLIRVADPLHALEDLARGARARLSPDARVTAVTGSAGKTGTKETLRACFGRLGATHAADKSFNNHWGVPLTLARMPAATRFAVIEIGMNHAGEITPLTNLTRPHAAIVTTVEAVHLEHFPSVEGIAEAKAEIFLGLEPGGTAIINADNPHKALLVERAKAKGANIMLFGKATDADVRLVNADLRADGSTVEAVVAGRPITYRLATPGAHIVQNALAVAAALSAAGVDLDKALAALADLAPPPGRGARTRLSVDGGDALLIDESYNANPASMRAALSVLATIPRSTHPRRIAVLGDMLELGKDAATLHAGLKDALDAAGVDLLFAAGPNMAHLYEQLAPGQKGAWGETSASIESALLAAIRAGDAVMIKGSFGSRMGPLAEALRGRFQSRAV